MTRFVHCRGCGVQIHETATACPKCGAPQAAVASPAAAAVPARTPAGPSAPITSYDQVPWYRKRWFCLLLLFVFVPALVVIAFTGDVYYVRKGELKTFTKMARISSVGLLVIGLARVLLS